MPIVLSGSPAHTCFVMQPFDRAKFDKRYTDIFEPAIKLASLQPYRVDRDPSVTIPIEEIQRGIENAALCFAEITNDNPNVWFELGFAIALGKPVCLVCSSERTTPFPFDVRHRNIITYDVGSTSDYEKCKADITRRLSAMLKTEGSLERLAQTPATKLSHGLTPHDITAFTIIASSLASLSPWEIRNSMIKAGFNELGTRIAIEHLKQRGLIEQQPATDQNGEEYPVLELTTDGKRWLLDNDSLFDLNSDPEPTKTGRDLKESDIPF